MSLCLPVLLASLLKIYLWVTFVSFTVTYAASTLPVKNIWGGVAPSPFASISVQNKWEGVQPSPFVSICVPKQTGRGSTLPICINMCPKQTGMVESSPFMSIHIQNKQRALNPPHSCPNWSKQMERGSTLPVRAQTSRNGRG